MPFISKQELDATKGGVHDQGNSEGRRVGYRLGFDDGVAAAWAIASTASSISHLDALDLVIDAFDLRKQYPSAQRFYDDLIAAKKFKADHDAFHRIEDASTNKGFDQGFDKGVDAAYDQMSADEEGVA